MELKTLKDIKWHYFPQGVMDAGDYARIWELKEEAIKHIKDIKNRPCGQAYSTEMSKRARIDWIKHFFNITEEDLK